MPNRNELISAARELKGTPFRHQGRTPGVGIDCAGVGIIASRAVGIILPDMQGYSSQPDGESLLKYLNTNLILIPIKEAQKADVLIMYFKRSPQHIAILAEIGNRQTIIHATLEENKVIEQTLDAVLRKHIIRAYRVPGIT